MKYEKPTLVDLGPAAALTQSCLCGEACDCDGRYKLIV